jgi:formyltetrahydrofolate deformylase
MRTRFTKPAEVSLRDIGEQFQPIAEDFGMAARLYDADRKTRTLIMVSKLEHCLSDLLQRMRIGSLAIDVPIVVSNHEDMRSMVEWHGITYVHLPIDAQTKDAQEAKLRTVIAEHDIELVVLARYMQVLSAGLSSELYGRAINIHHSFLPSFKGARPYAQAYDRGVKLIGATAHYVTSSLDEGPIIEQDVERVSHQHDAAHLAATGRDIERVVLARAIAAHVEHRVLINGHKTVVFS